MWLKRPRSMSLMRMARIKTAVASLHVTLSFSLLSLSIHSLSSLSLSSLSLFSLFSRSLLSASKSQPYLFTYLPLNNQPPIFDSPPP